VKLPEMATYYLPEMHSFATRMGIRFSPDVLFFLTRVHTIRAREEFMVMCRQHMR